ncbi:MAG TPA: alpha/beta fold hydrolase [Terriglobales bacterium]
MLSQAQRPALPPIVETLYPFTTRQLQVGEERMSFAEVGSADAPPLLFVHGNLTWSFLFREAIKTCAEKFHVIAPDHVGFGLSSKPAQAAYHTLEQHIANLVALVEALHLERITLVLHEWGGPIGLGFATRFPEKVQRIVLLNTFALPIPADLKPSWQLRLLNTSVGSVAPRALLSSALRSLSASSLPEDVLNAYQLPLAEPNGLVAPLAFARMLPMNAGDANARTLDEIASNLKSVTARVEMVWGKRDPILGSPLTAYMLRDAFPNSAEPRWPEHTGHLVPEDAPIEVTDALLAPFRPKPKPAKPLLNILK